MTGIFTSKAAERTAQIKAQQESKGPQVVGNTQVSLRPAVHVCAHAVYFYLRHQLQFGFHRQVLLSEIKGGSPTERRLTPRTSCTNTKRVSYSSTVMVVRSSP